MKTYSIITTAPNEEMSSVHNRMPVILHPEDEVFWFGVGGFKFVKYGESLLPSILFDIVLHRNYTRDGNEEYIDKYLIRDGNGNVVGVFDKLKDAKDYIDDLTENKRQTEAERMVYGK